MILKLTRQATAKAIAPPEGDYIEWPFRLSSVGFCEKDCVEFTEDVLRAALPLFAPRKDASGQESYLLVLADHDHSAGAWLGQVRAATWAEATEAMPAGIDGLLRLYRTADPRIVTGVETGVLTAGSICFSADVTLSHPEISEDEFEGLAGTKAPDGSIYRYIAKSIYDISEFSIVWKGADPTAVSLSRSIAEPDTKEPIDLPIIEETNIMDEILKGLIEKLGLAPEATTEDVMAALEALQGKLAEAEASLAELEPKMAEAEVGRATAERSLATMRAEALVDSHGIAADKRPALIARAVTDYEGIKLALEAIPVTRSATPTIPGGVTGGHRVEETLSLEADLTAEDIQAAKRSGIPLATFRAMRSREAK